MYVTRHLQDLLNLLKELEHPDWELEDWIRYLTSWTSKARSGDAEMRSLHFILRGMYEACYRQPLQDEYWEGKSPDFREVRKRLGLIEETLREIEKAIPTGSY